MAGGFWLLMSSAEACLHPDLRPSSSGGWSTSRFDRSSAARQSWRWRYWHTHTFLQDPVYHWLAAPTCSKYWKPGRPDSTGGSVPFLTSTPCCPKPGGFIKHSPHLYFHFPAAARGSPVVSPITSLQFKEKQEISKIQRKGVMTGKDKQGRPFIHNQTRTTKLKQQLLLFNVKGSLLSLILGQWTHHLWWCVHCLWQLLWIVQSLCMLMSPHHRCQIHGWVEQTGFTWITLLNSTLPPLVILSQRGQI